MEDIQRIKVSIGLIAYKHAKYIRQALDSILNQKVNFIYEVVIGDDCSNDGTREILLEFQEKYPDKIFPIINTTNVGASRNSMQVRERLKGEYIIGGECDDFWIGFDKLQQQVDFLDSHPEFVAVGTNHVNTDVNGKNWKVALFPWQVNRSYSLIDFFQYGYTLHNNTILHRNVIPINSDKYKKLKLAAPTMGDVIQLCLLLDKSPIFILSDITHAHRSGIDTPTSFSYTSKLKALDYTRMYARIVEALNEYFEYKYDFSQLLANRIAGALIIPRLLGRSKIDKAQERDYINSLSEKTRYRIYQRVFQKLVRLTIHRIFRPFLNNYYDIKKYNN